MRNNEFQTIAEHFGLQIIKGIKSRLHKFMKDWTVCSDSNRLQFIFGNLQSDLV
jgi:hypothetical protein